MYKMRTLNIYVLAAIALQLLVGLCQSACPLLASSACAHVGNIDQCNDWVESLQEFCPQFFLSLDLVTFDVHGMVKSFEQSIAAVC